MSLRIDLYRLVDELLAEQPDVALRAYRRITEHELPWLEQRVVALARREKWTDGKIARYLGRSRQAVHAKFKSVRPAAHSGPDAPSRYELQFLKLYDPLTNRIKPFARDVDDEAVAW